MPFHSETRRLHLLVKTITAHIYYSDHAIVEMRNDGRYIEVIIVADEEELMIDVITVWHAKDRSIVKRSK